MSYVVFCLLQSEDIAVDACIVSCIFASHIKLPNFNGEPGISPSHVLLVLVEEPLLEAAFFDVALQDEHALHKSLLNDEIVDLLILLRDARQYLLCLLIEVIMLVLCELLPPFLAARQRHSLKKGSFAPLEIDVSLDSLESLSEELFTKKRAESPQSDPLHSLLYLIIGIFEGLL